MSSSMYYNSHLREDDHIMNLITLTHHIFKCLTEKKNRFLTFVALRPVPYVPVH